VVEAAGAQAKVLLVTLSIESVTFLSPVSKQKSTLSTTIKISTQPPTNTDAPPQHTTPLLNTPTPHQPTPTPTTTFT
jgi:hypothetical protein